MRSPLPLLPTEPAAARRQRLPRRVAGALLAAAAASLAGCTLRYASVEVPEPVVDGAAAEPDLAVDRAGRLLGVWGVVDSGGAADIVVATYDHTIDRWSPTRRVNGSPRTAVAGRQVGPRLATTREGRVIVSWVERASDPAGDIALAVSDDDGATFSPPILINDDGARGCAQEYHDITVAPDGTIALVWLDERDAPAGEMNRKQLYFASSTDGGRTFSPNRPLSDSEGGVCPCCRPGIVAASDGTIHAIYRDRVGDRLFVRMRSRAAGATKFSAPLTLSSGWRYPGCPVNGPAIATAPGGTVWALWVEGAEDGEALHWGRSVDGGASFSVREALEPVVGERARGAGHLGLTTTPRGVLATWENGAGQVCALLLPASGDASDAMVFWMSENDAPIARSPAAVASANGVSVCWIEEPFGAQRGAAVPRHHRLRWSDFIASAAGRRVRGTSCSPSAPLAQP